MYFIYWFKLINTLYEIFGFLKTLSFKLINIIYEIFGFLIEAFLYNG